MPDALDFVHSLEHGRIEIQYSPDLPEDQLALKGVFDESPAGMLLFPNTDMPYEVAATAWTQLMGCKEYEGQPRRWTRSATSATSIGATAPSAQVPITYRALRRGSLSSSLLARRSRIVVAIADHSTISTGST